MSSELTRQCLIFDERPSTPPDVKKYRRSNYLEPGKRFQHHGVADDYPNLQLEHKIFGMTDRPGRETASDLIHHEVPTDLQRINQIKAEAKYKRSTHEPLGHSPTRQISLPDKFATGTVPFGYTSKNENQRVKDLIFPVDNPEVNSTSDLYKKSHGSYGPGEQRRRGYNWNIDPETTRFGAKGDTIAFNGVSKNISEVLKGSDSYTAPIVNTKKVEDFRNMGDILGQSKNLGQDSGLRPHDMIYGKPSGSKMVTAADVLRGKYSNADLQPDRDLGKSITPGFRNLTFQDRVYGCPSIRSDIPSVPYSRRSLADSQNYGDDVPAQDLINPPAFSDLSIGPLAMNETRSKQQILAIFQRIGYKLDSETADELFYQASGGSEYSTINAFRNVLNQFIIDNNLLNERK